MMCELETTKIGYRESNDHLIHEKRSLTFEKEHRKPRCADEKKPLSYRPHDTRTKSDWHRRPQERDTSTDSEEIAHFFRVLVFNCKKMKKNHRKIPQHVTSPAF